jgi:TolA-binding protein
LKAENDQRGSGNTQLSSQIQSLNDSVDELKTRIANLTTQVQSIPGPDAEREWDAGAARRRSPRWGHAAKPGSGVDRQAAPQLAPASPRRLPSTSSIKSALRDYNSAKYNIAASEFGDVIHYYPQDLWREMPSFTWVRSTTARQVPGRRSRATTRFWSSTRVTQGSQRPSCARDSR